MKLDLTEINFKYHDGFDLKYGDHWVDMYIYYVENGQISFCNLTDDTNDIKYYVNNKEINLNDIKTINVFGEFEYPDHIKDKTMDVLKTDIDLKKIYIDAMNIDDFIIKDNRIFTNCTFNINLPYEKKQQK